MGSLGLFLQCATSTVFSLGMNRLVRRFGSRRVYLSSMVSFAASALVICLSSSVVVVTTMTALTGFAYATLQTVPYTLTCHYHKEEEVRTWVSNSASERFINRYLTSCFYVWFQVYMPKGITRSLNANGKNATLDSAYLTPVEEEDGVQNHKMTPYRNPVLSQDGYEYFPLQQNQNGSPQRPSGPEQDGDEPGSETRGVGLDFALLDSTFLLSQVIPTLFMGAIVQFAHSVTAYIACSAIFGAVAIYLASHIVFEQKDLRS